MDGIEAEQLRKKLMADGWAQLYPPVGGAAYRKGPKYLDRLGNKVSAPDEKTPLLNKMRKLAAERIQSASDAEIAQFVMGDNLTEEGLRAGYTDKSFLDPYSDEQLYVFLTDEMKLQPEEGKEWKRGHMVQMINSRFAAK